MSIKKRLSHKISIPDHEQASSLRQQTTTYLKDKFGTRTEAAAELTTLIDQFTNERTGHAIENTVTRFLERYESSDEFELSNDRALEDFLRRYDLEKTRLDDHLLEVVQTRLTARTTEETTQSLARIADELSGDSKAGVDRPIDSPLTEVLSQFLIDDTQGRVHSLDDFLERDAVDTAQQVEQLLVEDLPRLVEETRTTDVNTEQRHAPRTTAAVAAMAMLYDNKRINPGFESILVKLASHLLSTHREVDGPPDTGLADAFPEIVRSIREEDVDFEIPNSKRTSSIVLVALFIANLVGMGLGAWKSYRHAPPIPDEIQDPNGNIVTTGEQVRLGKKLFQANGLMNQGSILGNGSYFGVDLTADALYLKAEFMQEYYAQEQGGDSIEALDEDEQVAIEERVKRELDADAPDGSTIQYSAAEVYAHRRIREQYIERYHEGDPDRGIPTGFIETPEQAERIADFAVWTAWFAHTNRPDSTHSYTNDWPYEPAVGNRPTGQVLVWSTISVLLLIFGGGLGVWAYHSLDFAEPTTDVIDVPSPDSVSITPTQYAAAWYVPVAGALFAVQVLTGALLAHYYVERTGFFRVEEMLGIDLVSLLPFTTVRTWHLNLAILWITTLWLAGGLFLPGLFSDHDPPWQAAGASVLLGLLVIATAGAFAGVWFGIQGTFGSPEESRLWWWLGSEGLEYLEVGRLWKLLLLGGLAGWTGLVLRSVRQMDEPLAGLGHFLVYAGGSIGLLFGASMLYTPETNMAVTEFWRWWVVHMWVEGVFEFFVVAIISVALVSMELLEKEEAEKAILFEVFAIMAAGIVGVSHHYWWVGLPDFWVPLGTTFSTLEFVPLVFVLYRSIGEYRSLKSQDEEFPYTIPLLFILGSSIWNFVGGGVLGFFVNLPVINYYEHGTYLSVAHAHGATFGAFGLLALGLGTYILRVVTPEAVWDPTWFRVSFWFMNVGLTIMVVASLLPVGFAQLRAVYTDGYAAARSLEFYEQPHIQTLLWARSFGDTPMILGALTFTAGAVRHLYAARKAPLEWNEGTTGPPA
ncbi:cbb3-type cytochrome c oxidase subunit I (plasmid) [Haladaptatus sp. SPP-AMP-3]|uniref:nitric-oxide reductase large subunit n=1 Tax=Haladaptatus sp. SPP-AMP-3 TaxID=3121295 RepID=UPI003C305230